MYLLRTCEEARRGEITSASVTGFALYVHGKKTCGVFVVLLWWHGNYFDSVCLEQGDTLVVLGLVGVNHRADLASSGDSTGYGIWHLTGQWLLPWQPPRQLGLPPTLLVVGITDISCSSVPFFLPSAWKWVAHCEFILLISKERGLAFKHVQVSVLI